MVRVRMQRACRKRRDAKRKAKASDRQLQSLMARIIKMLPEEQVVTRANVGNPNVVRLLTSIGLQPSQGEVLVPQDTRRAGDQLQCFKNAFNYAAANADTELVGGLKVMYSAETLVARVHFAARHIITGKLVDVTSADSDALLWVMPAGFLGASYKTLHTISCYPSVQCTFPAVVTPPDYVNAFGHKNTGCSVVVHVNNLTNHVRVFMKNVEIDASQIFTASQ